MKIRPAMGVRFFVPSRALPIPDSDPWIYSDWDEPEYYWLFDNRKYGNYGDYIRYEDTWQYLLEKTTYDEKTYQYEHLVFLLIVGFSGNFKYFTDFDLIMSICRSSTYVCIY